MNRDQHMQRLRQLPLWSGKWRGMIALLALSALIVFASVFMLVPASRAARAPFPTTRQTLPPHHTGRIHAQVIGRSPRASQSAQSNGNVSLHGSGYVLEDPRYALIFWGPEWGTANTPSAGAQDVLQYFDNVSGTSFEDILTQYTGGDGGHISDQFPQTGIYFDNRSDPIGRDSFCGGPTLYDDGTPYDEIWREIEFAKNWNGWDDPNTIYFLYLPAGYYVWFLNNGQPICSDSATASGTACAYHSYLTGAIGAYAVIPYPITGDCMNQDRTSDYQGAFASLSSHEQFEAITNPDLADGWYRDSDGQEIGDLCVLRLHLVTLGTLQNVLVQEEWSNAENDANGDSGLGCAISYPPGSGGGGGGGGGGSTPTPVPTSTPTPIPATHYDYSSIFWGNNTGSNVDLAEAAYDSRTPGWGLVDVSNGLRARGQSIPSLTSNAGSPGVVSYVDNTGVTRLDVFALGANGAIGHYDYDASTGTWAYGGIGASVGLPTLQPNVLALNPWEGAFGITSGGYLIEYFTNSAPYGTWGGSDITQQAGFNQSCDSRIRPAVTAFTSTVEVFADCGSKLTQFFYASGWHTNQDIAGGLAIPNVSVSFPGHSIAALVTAGTNPAMEVYVASDTNDVNALSEALYTTGGGWTQNRLPATSFSPDQVYAASQPVATSGGAPMSEVLVTGAPGSSRATANPPTAQYVYQPATPSWQITSVPAGEVTSAPSIVEVGDNNAVITEAATGAYTTTSGCTGAAQVEYLSNTLGSGATQSWTSEQTISSTALADNAGVPPGGNIFDYALPG